MIIYNLQKINDYIIIKEISSNKVIFMSSINDINITEEIRENDSENITYKIIDKYNLYKPLIFDNTTLKINDIILPSIDLLFDKITEITNSNNSNNDGVITTQEIEETVNTVNNGTDFLAYYILSKN